MPAAILCRSRAWPLSSDGISFDRFGSTDALGCLQIRPGCAGLVLGSGSLRHTLASASGFITTDGQTVTVDINLPGTNIGLRHGL